MSRLTYVINRVNSAALSCRTQQAAVTHTHRLLLPCTTTIFRRTFAVKPGQKRYTKAHEWVRLDDANSGYIGISDYAQKELGDVVYVELPEKGSKFQRGETFASVESTKAASSVYAPVDIAVNDTNEDVVQNTALVNQSAESKAWFVQVHIPKPDQLDELLDEKQYQKFCKEDAKKSA